MQREWLQLSKQNELAATQLLDASFHRSSVSRFYYSAFAAAHAVLIERAYTLPDLGNWSHKALPEAIKAGLGGDRDAKLYAMRLAELYVLRIEADYGVNRSVDRREAVRSRKLAGPILRLADRMISK